MFGNDNKFEFREKEIELNDIILDKLENPVARSLYLYLKQERPKRLMISKFSEQIFETKAAACRVLMIMATLELEHIGYLKESIHTHDKIEFIYTF
jgi:competence transcription factor ComK